MASQDLWRSVVTSHTSSTSSTYGVPRLPLPVLDLPLYATSLIQEVSPAVRSCVSPRQYWSQRKAQEEITEPPSGHAMSWQGASQGCTVLPLTCSAWGRSCQQLGSRCRRWEPRSSCACAGGAGCRTCAVRTHKVRRYSVHQMPTRAGLAPAHWEAQAGVHTVAKPKPLTIPFYSARGRRPPPESRPHTNQLTHSGSQMRMMSAPSAPSAGSPAWGVHTAHHVQYGTPE